MTQQERLSVRRADDTDVIAMRELAEQAYRPYVERIGRQPAPMTTDYGRAVQTGHAWVAQHGERVVGILVLGVGDDHLVLENVAVLPQAQSLGVGSRLLGLAEEQAQAHGLRQVRLHTNEAMSENLTYHPRRGYRETHRATQDGFRRVFFVKELD